MKRILSILVFLFLCVGVKAQVTDLVPGKMIPSKLLKQTGWTADSMMYIYLPKGYNEEDPTKYPIIFQFDGNGEYGDGGTDLPKLKNQGIPKLIDQGGEPYSSTIPGDTTRFIMTVLQVNAAPSIYNLRDWYNTIREYDLNIDTNRIFLTGLSSGGGAVQKMAGIMWDWKTAAIVAMSPDGQIGFPSAPVDSFYNTPIWIIQGDNDPTIQDRGINGYNNLVQAFGQKEYKLTVFSGGHCCWSVYYDPEWSDDISGTTSPNATNETIYDWMLRMSSNNKLPVIVTDRNIHLPFGTSSVTLDASESYDPDGQVISYSWTTSSDANIVSPSSAVTNVTGLNNGNTYVFNLTITDDSSATATADVTVKVAGEESTGKKKIAINFSGMNPWEVRGWNNFYANSINSSIPNLLDTAGAPTGIGIYMTSTFNNYVQAGNVTGDDSGAYPDSVIVGGGKVDGKVASFDITGLQDTTLYQIRFMPSVTSASTTHMSVMEANGKIDSVDAARNKNNLGELTDIQPVGGTINVVFREGADQFNSYLSGMDLTWQGDTGGGGEDPDDPEPAKESYKIPLSIDTKYWDGDTAFMQVIAPNGGEKANTLIDEQGADPKNGIDEPIPETLYHPSYTSQFDYPNSLIIDLGGDYTITDLYFYSANNYAYIYVMPGTPENFTDTLEFSPRGTGWVKVNTDSIKTRFFKVKYNTDKGGNMQINEMMLYGFLNGEDSLSRVNPNPFIPHQPSTQTMGNFMGFNQLGPMGVDSVGSLKRHYYDMDWIDSVTTEHNVDSIKFVFSVFGHPKDNTTLYGSTSYYYFPGLFGPDEEIIEGKNAGTYYQHQDALRGTGTLDAIQKLPMYAKEFGKPVDTVNHKGAIGDSAYQYDRVGRMAWTFGAFYGFNPYPEDSMQTPYPDISGLGIRAFVENGNEMNASWVPRSHYFSPKEFVAYSSAFYDGHMGTMGSRMGVKNADPGMEVIQAGTAGAHIDRLRALHYFIYNTRRDSVPFDALNFHTYPSSGINGAGENPVAYSPEMYMRGTNSPIERYVKEANDLFPGMPVWLTEWGYARHGGFAVSVPTQIGNKDTADIHADWMARAWFLLSFSGIDKSTMFQLVNAGVGAPLDTLPADKFSTMGLLDGYQLGFLYDPSKYTISYYAFPAYYFQRAIYDRLNRYKPDSIIYENKDSLYVYRYRNVDHPDSVAYAVWSGTITDKIVSDYSMKVGDSQAEVVELKNKMFRGSSSVVSDDGDGNIPLTISETPKMVFTTFSEGGGELVINGNPPLDPPVADAGQNQNLSHGTTSTTLDGSGSSDSDGSIVSYSWQQISGNTVTIVSSSSVSTNVTGLQDGNSYTFRLTVTDNDGLSDNDDVTVTVESAPVIIPPTADAGENQTVPSETTTVTLVGSYQEGTGSVTSVLWEQNSGPAANIVSPYTNLTTVENLQSGNTYSFRFTVMDDEGEQASDDVTISVKPEEPTIKRIHLLICP